jgi:hypothetical protein
MKSETPLLKSFQGFAGTLSGEMSPPQQQGVKGTFHEEAR